LSEAGIQKSATVQQSICNRHFEEVIVLAKLKSKELGRIIGIYPETKHPSFHQAQNLHITDKLLEE
jgi:glycerophosphoryl diester phosphodiesterase